MRLINQSYKIIDDIDGEVILKKLELCGRICYKSEDLIKEDSAERFLKNIITRGHESVLEHVNITVQITTNRAIANELVRHRIASYSQESSRYCNYSKGKFESEVTYIKAGGIVEGGITTFNEWHKCLMEAEKTYLKLLAEGLTPDQARGTLPLDLATDTVVTMNIRSWRNFFKQRTSHQAHYQMREIARLILDEFKEKVPVLFNDIEYKL